jgi:hypothetical protein
MHSAKRPDQIGLMVPLCFQQGTVKELDYRTAWLRKARNPDTLSPTPLDRPKTNFLAGQEVGSESFCPFGLWTVLFDPSSAGVLTSCLVLFKRLLELLY